MKKLWMPIAAAACLAIACNNNTETDSVEKAEMQNGQKDSSVTLLGVNQDSLDTDKDFLVKAASGGMLEVELGKMAQTNASDASVKSFGKQMITDHTKANTELMALAKAKNVTVPTVPGSEAQEHIQEMQGMKGADFDKHYVDMMVDDHKEDVEEFQKAADNAKDSAVKAYAVKTLPVLKAHLQKIQSIQESMKK
jgi:putative membrane protein